MPLGVAQRVLIGAGGGIDPYMEEIEVIQLGSAAASITFSGINTAFRMFEVGGTLVKDGTWGQLGLQLNGSTSGYTWQDLAGANTSISAGRTGPTSVYNVSGPQSIGPNQAATLRITIGKQLASAAAMIEADTTFLNSDPAMIYVATGAIWNNTTDLISTIALLSPSGNFAAGSTVWLNGDRSEP